MNNRRDLPAGDDRVLAELRTFFSSALHGEVAGIHDDYFTLGLANSLFALELVTFVERNFSITVEVADLDLDNFRTIARTAEFVRGKLAARSSPAGRPGATEHG